MIKFIRKYHHRMLQHLNNRRKQKKLKSYDKIKSVVLVFTMQDEPAWSVLRRCMQQFESEGKSVWLLGYMPKNANINFIITDANCCLVQHKTGINFWGVPNKTALESVANKHFDLLIDTTGKPSFITQYLSLSCNCDYLASYDNNTILLSDNVATETLPTTEVYDLVIKGDTDIDVQHFIENVKSSLLMIAH